MKIINKTGLFEIAEFLIAHHKSGQAIADKVTRLSAWADQAEFQLSEGNPATIEIKSWDSLSGHTETFTVSDAGIDTITIFDETGE